MTEFEETDLCILCNSPPPSPATGFIDSWKRRGHHSKRKLKSHKSNSARASTSFSENEEVDLLPQLRVFFLLQQIFKCKMHDESTLQIMRTLGDPCNWFQICEGCSDLVDHGMDVFRKLKMVEAQYLEIRKKLESKVVTSKSGTLEETGMTTDEHSETSSIRLNLRSKLRGGITGVLNFGKIKSEPVMDPVPEVEDYWEPCDDGFDADTANFTFTQPLECESSSSFQVNTLSQAKPRRGKRSKLLPPAAPISHGVTSAQETETTNRPRRSRGRPKKGDMGQRNQARKSTRTRKPRDSLLNEDLPQESDKNDDKPATDVKKEIEPSSFEPATLSKGQQAEHEKEDGEYIPGPSFSDDDDEDKDYHPSKKSKKTSDQEGSKLDSTSFLEIISECLDMSLVQYPPQTEEDKAKIPKLIKHASSNANFREEGKTKSGAHPCPSCNKTFTSKFHAISHIHRFHFGILKPWRCNQCEFSCATTRVLRRHLVGHQQGGVRVCTICNFSCQTKSRFDTHVINHQRGVESPACSECNLSFESFKEYAEHMVDKHGFEYKLEIEKRFVCEYCSKMCNSPRELEFHKLQSHNELTTTKFPECLECNKVFLSDCKLRSHVNYHHNVQGTPAFCCEHCGKDFKNLVLLNDHRAFWHVEEPESCRLCGMELRNALLLRKHMVKNHKEALQMSLEEMADYAKKKHKEMAFRCTLCPEKFAFNVLLYHHRRNNHEEVTEKFKCHLCGKGFSRKTSLKRHHETNHMDVRFTCEDCGKALTKESLVQHRRWWCPVKRQREEDGSPDVPETKLQVSDKEREDSPSPEVEVKE